jgi:hypothetical protein
MRSEVLAMIKRATLMLLGLLLVPGAAEAKGFGRKGSSGKGSSSSSKGSNSNSSSSSNSAGHYHAAAPAGSYGHNGYSRDGYYSRGNYNRGYYNSYSYGYGYGPRYYGWGVHPWGYYGYGYYPVYGGPVIAEEVPSSPPEITASALLGGVVTKDGVGLDVRGRIEGRRLGFDISLLTVPNVNPDNTSDRALMPYVGMHLTYSLVSTLQARLRLEAGGTGIFAPDRTYIGPDVGVTAQVALLGPLGLEGGIHLTPYPATVVDADAALALHFGNLTVRGGWRLLYLNDKRVNDTGGADTQQGPQLAVGLLF